VAVGRWRIELAGAAPIAVAGNEFDALHAPFGDGHDQPLHLLVK
jgi:hypothetical protein